MKSTTFLFFLMLGARFSGMAQSPLANEPIAQPSNLLFTSIKSYRVTAIFTAATPAANGYLILQKTGSAITALPEDGKMYQRGDTIGKSKVISSGSSLRFMANHIVANSNYYFAIFSYNGLDSMCNYLTSSPLTGMAASLNSMLPPNHYATISTSLATFIKDLHDKTYPHKQQSYGNYAAKFLAPFIARDTLENQRVITCVYSGENRVYAEPWDWTATGFSREHTFPKSWMPIANTANFEHSEAYSDFHQLFPVNQNKVNAVRSNLPFGEVSRVTSSYLSASAGFNSNGEMVYEPRDAQKGDAARAIMYQAISYYGTAGFDWALPNPISSSIGYGQNQSILKKWHYQDPPDNFEIARNDFLDSLQGNRNPFIDNPEYACYIDFALMEHITNPEMPCNTVGFAETEKAERLISIAPNPNNGTFTLHYFAIHNQHVQINLWDALSQLVYAKNQEVAAGSNNIAIQLKKLPSGLYCLQLLSPKKALFEKIVVNFKEK